MRVYTYHESDTSSSTVETTSRLPRRTMLAQLAGGVLALMSADALRALPLLAQGTQPKGAKWDDKYEVAIDLEFVPPSGYRYHRPYVAVWVEDASGKSVRTVTLWVQTTGRGGRYIRELRKWFGQQDDTTTLINTVSSATRNPGKYAMLWDGKDDKGALVNQGTYRLFIEAAQEHGTYALLQQELVIGAKPLSFDFTPSGEVSNSHIEYRKKA